MNDFCKIILVMGSVLCLSFPGCRRNTLYDRSVCETISLADSALASGSRAIVPSGAPGSENHDLMIWQNGCLTACGDAYRLTSKVEYADWVADVLCSYASMFPTLGYHPESWRTAEPGKLFWQVLDEGLWTLHAALAYGEVRDDIDETRRAKIDDGLMRPMAEFLMYGTEDNTKNNYVFNRMHNHATWLDAAVGAIGLALDDRDLVMRALYGTDLSGKHGGLVQQIDTLFSPDGYYMEGTVYQSFGLIPLLKLGVALRREMPELDYLDRRDGVLARSADAMFNLSCGQDFFRLNDSFRKTYGSRDIRKALPYLYYLDPERKWILSVIRDCNVTVPPDEVGLLVSRDIEAGRAEPVRLSSCMLRDGSEGEKGATMVLRRKSEHAPAVYMKACGQGSYHGHFDKLTIGYYENGNEILTEYGSARFNGIGPRNAGHYTALNRGYAMTTVAHNTLVADCTSHFGGVTPYGLSHSPRVLAFKGDGSGFQYMAAVDSNAYEGVRMERWVALVDLPFLESPLIADILVAAGDKPHRYDYPLHYNGQMINLNIPYETPSGELRAFGDAYGYQHLWQEAEASCGGKTTSYTWLCGDRFYSLSAATTPYTRFYMLRTGANDPDFYLRSEPAVLLREENAERHVFATCVESHGHYWERDELSSSPLPQCRNISVAENHGSIDVIYEFDGGRTMKLSISGGAMSCEY